MVIQKQNEEKTMTTQSNINLINEPLKQEANKALSEDSVKELCQELFNWNVTEVNDMQRLHKDFKFDTYHEAVEFAIRVASRAEHFQHHPRITINWKVTTVEWWTHDVGGLHRNDFIMAAKTDRLYDDWQQVSGRRNILDETIEETFPASDAPGSYIIEGGDE
jgi:4a-hydroxytetrahydrobiopterin dehydratase